MAVVETEIVGRGPQVLFDAHPDTYRHWKLAVDGEIARLTLDIDEDGGIVPGYKLKLNSYDLGVDIELNDAINRVRFEHPGVKCLVITSGKSKMFCSGANIYMLGQSTHGWKVNFCKFTNETRNGLEDSSGVDGLKTLAAVNGACAGGGYELALACDEILMIDDRSSTVSLPEVPLLGVLPGTGGLTRVIDKRRVRRDLADIFCTTAEGVRADRAQQWRLIDHIARPQNFDEQVSEHAKRMAASSKRAAAGAGAGIVLEPLAREIDADAYRYSLVEVAIDRNARSATITVKGPGGEPPASGDAAAAQACAYWPLALARELEDAMLMLRANEPECGLWLLRSSGEGARVLAYDAFAEKNRSHWFVAETLGAWRRLLSRFDVTSRSMFAIVDTGSCFAGTLFELALAADRSYMLDAAEEDEATSIALSAANFGWFPMASGITRIDAHYCQRVPEGLAELAGEPITASRAEEIGIVTASPDDLDWSDEIRIAIEERSSLSPDALTGMEASLRFAGPETMFTRVFGRLTAWQNWIFNRPNATGEHGALKLYGSGTKAQFDWKRI